MSLFDVMKEMEAIDRDIAEIQSVTGESRQEVIKRIKKIANDDAVTTLFAADLLLVRMKGGKIHE